MKNRKPRSEAPELFRPSEQLLAIEPTAITRSFLSFWDDDDEPSYDVTGSVAVVCIDGPLMQRGGWFWDGYESISERVLEALADPNIGAVVLRINSPGGVCAGNIECARTLEAAKQQSGKRMYAYADEAAYSAAYAIACAADEIWLPESGGVGSIGTIATAVDKTGLNQQMGLRVVVATSGAQKADLHPDVPFTKEAIARLQDRVDYLGRLFAGFVAERRRSSTDAVLGLEAATFLGAAAVNAQLADRVGNFSSLLAAASVSAATRLNVTAPPRATAAESKITMKTLFAQLGLAEGATEAEALAALAPIKDLHNRIASLTAKSEPEAALGVIQAWRASAEKLPEVEKDLGAARAAVKAADDKAKEAELATLIEDGRKAGKLTKAQAEGWAKTQTAASLAAFLEHAPVVVPREETKTDATVGAEVGAGKETTLTAEERAVAKQLGLTEKQMTAAKTAAPKEGALHDRARSRTKHAAVW